MPGLTRGLHGRRDERGAVAVLVVILLSSGVLLAMGALSVDVGGLYAEKAQLQNGADASAVAVALGCARGAAVCASGSAEERAGKHANSNANDGSTKVDKVCGKDPAGVLPSCPASTPGCEATQPSGVNAYFAQVATSTLNNGSTVLPPTFGKAVLGASYQGKTVHACARATWASVGAAIGISATVSICTWRQGTSSGTVFAPAGPYPPWPPGYPVGATPPAPGLAGGEQVLMLHGSGNDCAGSAGAGWQLPGGFGWLDDPSNNCTVLVNVNNTYPDRTGVPVKPDCLSVLTNARNNHTVIYLPVYDGVSGSGGNGAYHLAGFAAFVVTGGWVNGTGGGFKEKSLITSRNYCGGSDRCIYGFFTQALVPKEDVPVAGGSNFGTSIVKMTG